MLARRVLPPRPRSRALSPGIDAGTRGARPRTATPRWRKLPSASRYADAGAGKFPGRRRRRPRLDRSSGHSAVCPAAPLPGGRPAPLGLRPWPIERAELEDRSPTCRPILAAGLTSGHGAHRAVAEYSRQDELGAGSDQRVAEWRAGQLPQRCRSSYQPGSAAGGLFPGQQVLPMDHGRSLRSRTGFCDLRLGRGETVRASWDDLPALDDRELASMGNAAPSIAIGQPRRYQAARSQACHQRGRSPVIPRRCVYQALAPGYPAVDACHLGLGCLDPFRRSSVDGHEAVRLHVPLLPAPASAITRDIR